MGFFDFKATCAACGREVGLNRFMVGKTLDGKEIWICPTCKRSVDFMTVNHETGKITLIDDKETETRMKCNACGHVYCFTYADLKRNQKLAKGAVMDSVIGLGEAIGGTRIGAQMAAAQADAKMDRIVDYARCPHCNSSDVAVLPDAEWEIEKENKAQSATVPVSAADELKKFKELLDMGVITQEEFEAKKKQLLGL